MMNMNTNTNGQMKKMAITLSASFFTVACCTALSIGIMMAKPAHACELPSHNEMILEKIENEIPLAFSEIAGDIDHNFTVFDEDGYEVPVILLTNGVVIDNNGYAAATDKAASYKLHDGNIVYMYNPVTTTFAEWAEEEPISEEEIEQEKENEEIAYDANGKEVVVIVLKDGRRVDSMGYEVKGIADGASKTHSGKIIYDFDPTEMSVDDFVAGK